MSSRAGSDPELRREALWERLDLPADIIVVEGIEGSGKSTLLRQWSADTTSGERRVVVRAEPDFEVAMVLAPAAQALGAPTSGRLSTAEARELLAGAVAQAGRPVAVVILESDWLDGTELVDALARLRAQGIRVRFLVGTSDGNAIRAAAGGRSLSCVTVDDGDLRFTQAEVEELCRRLLPASGVTPAPAIWRATTGNPALVRELIEEIQPQEEASSITRERAFRRWPGGLWGRRAFEGFMIRMSGVSRFTRDEAAGIAGAGATAGWTTRLVRMGFGRMSFHPGLNQRVFVWDEAIRTQLSRSTGDPHTDLADWLRTAAVAADALDLELQVAALVEAGDLAAAERVLEAGLWEVLASNDTALWGALLRLGVNKLRAHPSLLVLRSHLAGPIGIDPSAPGRRPLLKATRDMLRRDDPDSGANFATLARATYAFCELGLVNAARSLATRAWELTGTGRIDAGAAPISDALILGHCLMQLDLGHLALRTGAWVLDTIALDATGQLDPDGRRACSAEELVRCAETQAGMPASVPPASQSISSLMDTRRESTLAVRLLAEIWIAIDAGDAAVAESLSAIAMTALRSPLRWPPLIWCRVIALGMLHRIGDIEMLWRRELSSPEWRVPQVDSGSVGPAAAVIEAVVPGLVGLRERSAEKPLVQQDPIARAVRATLGVAPSRPDVGDALRTKALPPRTKHALMLFEALWALRDGERNRAREALIEAAALLPGRTLAPLSLAFASRQEIDDLRAMVADLAESTEMGFGTAAALADLVPNTSMVVQLSEREYELLGELRQRRTNQEIAAALFISVNTVKFHRANLMRKLRARNLDQLLANARRLEL